MVPKELIRLSAERLVDELDRQANEQRLADKHDVGKQMKSFLLDLLADKLLFVKFALSYGDGSNTVSTTGHAGPMQIYGYTTEIPDFRHLFSGKCPIDSAKMQQSIADAKALRAATIVRAAQEDSVARHGEKQSAEHKVAEPVAAAQAYSDARVLRGRGAVMVPAAGTSSIAQQKEEAPVIFTAPTTRPDAAVSQHAVDMRGTIPSGSVTIDAATAEQVQRYLAAAQEFLTEKAEREQVAGTLRLPESYLKMLTIQENV